jgi:homoserine kinase
MIRAVAPASSANLGPGFDAAGAALDLWNELVVEDGKFAVELDGEGADEVPRDASHLALRAFRLFAPLEGRRFSFTSRIPLERGLGSSAAAIALGLVAGAAAAGRETTPDELLGIGWGLEGHADNLAAALNGGVCLTWRRNGAPHAARISEAMPAVAVVVVPNERTSTAASRSALPASVPHEDAAFTVGAAALLGAAVAAGDPALLSVAFADRLHEPYRAASTPLLRALQEEPPLDALGVTLSGSGPSVIVWTIPDDANQVAAELAAAHPDTTVLPLAVAARGAHVT